jgi:hypothetical protein
MIPEAVAIENHHPDKNTKPRQTIPISRKAHQQLHGIEVHDTPLSRLMRQYDKANTILVTMKNWSRSYQKDFATIPDIGIQHAIMLKKTLTKQLHILMKTQLPKVKHIKGFGPRYLAGILAYAHPNRFPSLRKFLFYCGYTQASRKLKRYNRRIRPIIYRLTRQVIMQKDKEYYPLYLKIKDDLGQCFVLRTKKAIDMMARNRIGTYLLKEVYRLFRVETERSCIFLQLPSVEGLSFTSTLSLHT